MKNLSLLVLVFHLFSTTLYSQLAPQVRSDQGPQPPAPVIKVSVTVVQVDAVVVDKQGRHVADLKPEDFRLLENGKPQKITNFSYIDVKPRDVPPTPTPIVSNAPPTPVARLKPEQIRRMFVFVVDDLNLTFDAMAYVRDALKRFANEQMQPGDMVSILLTGRGMGSLQQFTSDKGQLLLAAEKLRWNSFGYLDRAGDDSAALNEELLTVSSLDSLNYVVQSLGDIYRDLPGRKSVIYFSNGYKLSETSFIGSVQNSFIRQALQRVADSANRASVVLYTIEAGGLKPVLYQAKSPLVAQLTGREIAAEISEHLERQQSLTYIAEETGGRFMGDSNDLNVGIARALDDQTGYYLIGYTPQESSVVGRPQPDFHKITVEVNRPGVHVRSRTGFYSQPQRGLEPTPKSVGEQLTAAIMSPFDAGGIRVRLTPLFGYDPRTGPLLRSMLHVTPQDITFSQGADGKFQTKLNVLAAVFGEKGLEDKPISQSYTIQLGEKEYRRCLEEGLVYTVMVSAKRPGAYHLRIALQDDATGRMGSAFELVQVPDLSKGRIALSGIMLSGDSQAPQGGPSNLTPNGRQVPAPGETTGSPSPQTGPVVRQFRRGSHVGFTYQIYNAQLNKETQQPQLAIQMRLFKDNKLLFEKGSSFQPVPPSEVKNPLISGRLTLPKNMDIGQYILQMVVTDELAKNKFKTTSQWIDFEVLP